MSQRQTLPPSAAASRLVVVMRGERAEDHVPVIDTMAEAGVRSFELTLTTPGTFATLPGLLERYAETADIGIGTVTRPCDVDAAADGGAHYLVTPVSDLAVVDRALERDIAIVPGGSTLTQVCQVGPGYLRDLRGPSPYPSAIPSGGVDLESARAWLAAGAAVSVGGPLLGDALKGGDLGALAERARRFVEVCAGRGTG